MVDKRMKLRLKGLGQRQFLFFTNHVFLVGCEGDAVVTVGDSIALHLLTGVAFLSLGLNSCHLCFFLQGPLVAADCSYHILQTMHQRCLLQPRGSVSHSKNVFCCYTRTTLLSADRVCFCSPSREGLSNLCICDKICLETACIFTTHHRRSFTCRLCMLGSLAIRTFRKVNVTTLTTRQSMQI